MCLIVVNGIAFRRTKFASVIAEQLGKAVTSAGIVAKQEFIVRKSAKSNGSTVRTRCPQIRQNLFQRGLCLRCPIAAVIDDRLKILALPLSDSRDGQTKFEFPIILLLHHMIELGATIPRFRRLSLGSGCNRNAVEGQQKND